MLFFVLFKFDVLRIIVAIPALAFTAFSPINSELSSLKTETIIIKL
jgi:hypothetical protein